MNLEALEINRLKSIEHSNIYDFGRFNVFIGKNNAGKSNLLTAIDTFFACLKNGDIVTLDPPVGQEIDFFDRSVTEPIQITLTFALSLAERDALVREIATEAANMKNAIEGVSTSLWVSITVSIVASPSVFGYVSDVVLLNQKPEANTSLAWCAPLLKLSPESANELRM